MRSFPLPLPSIVIVLAGSFALTATGCKNKDYKKVDIETLDAIVAGSTTQLLDDIRAEDSAEEMWVAWVGVDNQSNAPLGPAQEDTNRNVSEILVNDRNSQNSKTFRMISEQQVKAASAAAAISRSNELTLKAPREKFLAQLAEGGRVPDYLMFGSFTNADTSGEARRFRLSLQMMHATSGEIRAERSGVFTKEK